MFRSEVSELRQRLAAPVLAEETFLDAELVDNFARKIQGEVANLSAHARNNDVPRFYQGLRTILTNLRLISDVAGDATLAASLAELVSYLEKQLAEA
jgi:hypothetical protein